MEAEGKLDSQNLINFNSIEEYYETLRLHYDNQTNYSLTPVFDYSKAPYLLDSQKTVFIEKLQKLPLEIQKVVRKIVIDPSDTQASGRTGAIDEVIQLSYMGYGVFTHELGHVIDFKSGYYNDPITKKKAYGFSGSKEFGELYDRYIKNNTRISVALRQKLLRRLSQSISTTEFMVCRSGSLINR